MARLDVLHIAPSHLPLLEDSGGIAVHRHALALARAGLEVAVASIPAMLDGLAPRATEPPEPRCIEGVDCYSLTDAREPLADLRALFERRRPRVVHAHHNQYFASAEALARMLGVPLVYTCHVPIGDPDWMQIKQHRIASEAITHFDCARRCDRFIAFTPAGAERIVRCMPELDGRVRVVGHGVDDRSEIAAIARDRSARANPTALYIGRFEAEKGILELIDAIPLALARRPELRFTLVGAREGTPRPAADPRVRVLPWSSQAELERELAEADVFVSPSVCESFGMAMAEAMLFGLPIIATRTEGARALVEPADCGVWIPSRDPAALAAALVELGPERALELGRRGAAHARAALGWDKVARAMIAVYRELDPRVVP
jgi:glycosyltransferase involved in cell wall biosynthesis